MLRASVIALGSVGMLASAAHAWLGLDLLVHRDLLPGCAFRALFGLPCPGCGMTQALLLLTQLRVADSIAAHPAALPGIALTALWSLRPELLRPLQRDWIVSGGLVALIGVWLLRLAQRL